MSVQDIYLDKAVELIKDVRFSDEDCEDNGYIFIALTDDINFRLAMGGSEASMVNLLLEGAEQSTEFKNAIVVSTIAISKSLNPHLAATLVPLLEALLESNDDCTCEECLRRRLMTDLPKQPNPNQN